MLQIGAVCISILYLAVSIWTEGDIPQCLSDTAYTVGKREFLHLCISLAVLLGFSTGMHTQEEWRWICFVGSASICGTGVAQYKDSLIEYRIHYACSLLAMASVVALYAIRGELLVTIFLSLSAFLGEKWLLGLEIGVILLAAIY